MIFIIIVTIIFRTRDLPLLIMSTKTKREKLNFSAHSIVFCRLFLPAVARSQKRQDNTPYHFSIGTKISGYGLF